ncbi:hypothetical protein LMG28614_06032 [Paraburkholderia ultramafica]|uniref:Uncharacterized protein n=1 Tax=Paraburkholderia ultramafica TaxID=1544867 RepID=A0A6S7BVJ3_9BURK|nr:hypothetical protein [Paraburkholderia ultramafica]CAB3804430.1 hypothetical protein LMG28614_06032 [Paraburkholderia ultramafica]
MKISASIAKIVTALSVAGAAASAHAISNHQFFLVNETDQAVVEFYATHLGDPRGPDLLGIQTLPSGYNVLINAYDGDPRHCFFNFKSIMEDGQTVYKRNVNVCEIIRYTISSD